MHLPPPGGLLLFFIRCASHSLVLVHPSVICVWADGGERRIFASKEITKKGHRLMRLTIPPPQPLCYPPCARPAGRAGRHAEPPPAAHRSHRRLRRHKHPGAPQDRPCPRAGRRDDCERDQGSDGARLCLLRLSRSLRGLQTPSCKCSTSAKRGASPTLWGATRKPVCDSRDNTPAARSCSKS